MKPIPFELALVVAAVVVTALLWFLGYWIIAFAAGIVVFAVGTAAYIAVRAGKTGRHAGQT